MGKISSSTADVENMATIAWRINFAENPDGLGDVVKRVRQYFSEWAAAYLFTNMNWSPKHDFKLIACSIERTNFYFSKNSLI